uniref:hypothetical protein n=1 Tax=Hydrotalea flava TaxID=714549 RepID=UPI000833F2B3
ILHPYTPLLPNATHLRQLVQQLHIHTIILNYSGYGYQRKGVPLWLVKAMEGVKAMGCRILIFFHELYASGPPWTSAFWLHAQQKKIFKQLYALANRVFCSNRLVQHLIQDNTPDAGMKSTCIGLFSNIPEPVQLPDWGARVAHLVVFGSKALRSNTYRAILQYSEWLQRLGIMAIVDIGEPLNADLYASIALPVKVMGILPAEQVSKQMAVAKFGALYYADHLLGKSGVWAAYSAHGLCIWNTAPFHKGNLDGLAAGKHYISSAQPVNPMCPFEQMAMAAFHWYRQHDFEQHLKAYQL